MTPKRLKIRTPALLTAAAAAALLLMAACGGDGNRTRSIMPDGICLKAGDVVLRRGSGLTSRAVLMADRSRGYSHVGIVVDSAGVMMVVHAVPGEPDYDGDPDRVKMETPQKFYSAVNAETGGVMRCADSTIAAQAADIAMQVYRRNTMFDHDYDDNDTTKMYCCQLVEHAYSRAGMPLVAAPRHSFSLPGMQIDSVMLPSDFSESPRLKTVTTF